MFDQLRRPDRDVTFRMSISGGGGINCYCRDLLRVRPEEQDLIRQCLRLEGGGHPRVLDIGCGIGRHSIFVRSLSRGAAITVVETDRELREHTVDAVLGAVSYEQLTDIPAQERFNVVFLLGNGLGVFGTAHATRDGLGRIRDMLSHSGSALIEAGNFAGGEFYEARLQIEYGGLVDGPFTWGYATRPWVERALAEVGLEVLSVTPSFCGGPFFIIHARNRA
jgi:SAM-dependent methyltransferase